MQTKTDIVEKYGGEEHLQAPPKSLLLAQTEEYVEYSRSGKVIKGIEKPKARSIYEEDVYINNHTTIWGSFWNAGRWGYKCCKSFIKNSYCVGMQEPEGYSEQQQQHTISSAASVAAPVVDAVPRIQAEEDVENKAADSEVDSAHSTEESSESEEEVKQSKKSKKKSKKREKKKKAKEQRKNKKKHKEIKEKETSTSKSKHISEEVDDRKRPYNSMYDVKAPTEEEIEEWKRKRTRTDDPMLQFL